MSAIVNKQVEVLGNIYTVEFPTVGKFIDIKVLEQKLSKGYSKELLMGLGEDIDAYLYITSYAHVKVLMPDLSRDLKINSLLDLSLEDFEPITEVYLKEIKPWFDDIKNKLRDRTLNNDKSE